MKTSILSFIVILIVAFTSCQNFEGSNPISSEDDLILKSAEIAINDLQTENVLDVANSEADFFAESEKALRDLSHLKGTKGILFGRGDGRYLRDECPNVSIDTSETRYPIVITLDYGDGTELSNGKVISGIIVIEVSAPKGTDGATRTMSYNNCVINGVSVDGSCGLTFNGDNETTRIVSTSSNVTFVMTDGLVIDRVGNHVREWLAGIDTPTDHSDDELEKTGSINLSSSEGDVWDRTIVSPLLRLGDCDYYVQGVVQITRNETVSVIDFGDGECDNLATLNVGGETIEIELGSGRPKANFGNSNQNSKGKRMGKK